LQRFVPKPVAAFAILFASFDPFFLGQSRLLDHEAMLSLFVIVSVLALALYLSQDRRPAFLLLSGVAAGFAQLTKSSAMAIFAPVGVLLLVQIVQEKNFFKSLKIFALWLVALVATYFIFWPGMWVAPQKMLYEVYGNAFSYAFQGGRLAVTGELQTSRFSLDLNFAGMWELTKILLMRTTPLTWLGVLFGCALPFAPTRERIGARGYLFPSLLISAAAFILMFGIAQGRNSPHYILCSYLALNLFAGLGWFYFIQRLTFQKWDADERGKTRIESVFQKIPRSSAFIRVLYKFFQPAALFVALFLQLSSAMTYYPYYFTYQSFGRGAAFPSFPYGEGLELAGQYLAKQPNAKDSTALVYYSRGCFSYFYPGLTNGFRPYYVDGAHSQDLLREIKSADYLVVYYAAQGQLDKYAGYIEALSAVKPIHEVWLNGRKYVIIYQVDSIPDSVFEALANLKPLP
jgi:hypothetical protein